MTLQIAQDAAPEDESHWRWSVWLDGSADDLDQVTEVVWKLHSTFNKPIRRVTSRSTQFRLDASGWGEFEIVAHVERRSTWPLLLRHWLRLEDPAAPKPESARAKKRRKSAQAPTELAQRQPSVFLSYDRPDADLADQLAGELRKQNITAFLDIDIPAGEDLSRWRSEHIADSDAMVILGANQPGIWQKREIDMALSFGTRMIPVAFSTSRLPEPMANLQAMKIKSGEPHRIAPDLAHRIGDAIKP